MNPTAILLVFFFIFVTLGSYFKLNRKKPQEISLTKAPVRIYFKKDLPNNQPGEELHHIKAKKTFPTILCTILALSILAFIYTLVQSGYKEYWVYILVLSGIFIYYFKDLFNEIILCENALVYKRLIGKKAYYYAEIDCIETFNIVNGTNSGAGYGYQVTKGGKNVKRFDSAKFIDLDALEQRYKTGYAGVSSIEILN